LLKIQYKNLDKNNVIKNIFDYMTFFNIIEQIEKKSFNFDIIDEENLIPKYILKSLSLNSENINKNLSEKWNDFSLFKKFLIIIFLIFQI
jgi:hypothetical protein